MRRVQAGAAWLRGAVSLEAGDGWVQPWRIPVEDLELFPPDGIGGTARHAAGVRLGLRSDTRTLEVHLAPAGAALTLDCVVDAELVATCAVAAGESLATFSDLPPGDKTIEVYLPQHQPVRLAGFAVEDLASVAPLGAARPRWITYGSSITQAGAAASPAQTWPALVARRNRWDLTCLGFSGNCHLEPMVARLIRDLQAEMISLCLGINVQGGNSLSPRTFRPAVTGFVRLVREGHPGVPIAVMSPILSPPRETQRNAVGLSLTDMRDEIRAAVQALRGRGDTQVHYVDGLEVFGEAELAHLPDLLHPDAQGQYALAANFQHAVAERVFGAHAGG